MAPEDSLGGDCGLALAHVLTPEEELAVQVAHVDGVQIDNFDLPEAGQYQDLSHTGSRVSGRGRRRRERRADARGLRTCSQQYGEARARPPRGQGRQAP